MGLGEATTAWQGLSALGLGFGLFVLVLVLYKGFLVTAGHCDALLLAERSKTELLRGELERREGLYIASLAELREQLTQTHAVREKLQAELAENNKQLFRNSDMLADLRDTIRASAPR